MKKIYIIQMHSGTVPSILVRILTGYKYSHESISFNKDCDKIYSFGRKKVNNPFNGGFSIEYKNGPFFTKFNKTICRIYELEVTEEQYNDIKNIIDNMEKNRDKYKYDYLGIFLRFFRIPISFKYKYVCSNFLAEVLEKANVYKFDKKTCFIEPKDFENIKGAKEIYVGSYIDYAKEPLKEIV